MSGRSNKQSKGFDEILFWIFLIISSWIFWADASGSSSTMGYIMFFIALIVSAAGLLRSIKILFYK